MPSGGRRRTAASRGGGLSGIARIVIQSFVDAEDPMLASWLGFRDAVVAAAPVETPVGGRRLDRLVAAAGWGVGPDVAGDGPRARLPEGAGDRQHDTEPIVTVWRLLASNNRELARSASSYSTPANAKSQLWALRPRAAQLEIASVVGARGDRNGWYLVLEAVPVLTCSRWYGAAASSLDSARIARIALAEAVVDERVQLLTDSRRRAPHGGRR